MKTEEYIASGILENYLLGLVSPQEKQEVECMSHIYPEIKKELDALELAMENYLMAQKTPVLETLWHSIESKLDDKTQKTTQKSVVDRKEIDVVPINRTKQNLYWLWVPSIAAILIIGFFLFQTKNDLKNKEGQIAHLDTRIKTLQKQNDGTIVQLNKERKLLAFFSDPNMKSIMMKGVPTKDTSANSQIYWNKVTKNVMLCIGKLPINSEEKQYQLWAMVDGKPIDLGVFDVDGTRPIVQMKSIGNPQAFAVTLEKKGGNPTPTLEELYVLGAISS